MTHQPDVTLHPNRLPWVDKPGVVRDFAYQVWTRGEGYERIKIDSWYAVKESPSGGWTCTLRLTYIKPDGECFPAKGRAGGYGYCKFSQAFYDAFNKLFPQFKEERGLWGVAGAGESAVSNFLVSLGFKKIAGGQ